jgi:predicted Co/Zn/Cd cation transporter (cation efflux family)
MYGVIVMPQKEIERKSLIVSSIVNSVIASAGIWAFFATHIQALFLDSFFSVIGLISSSLAVVISRASKKKTTFYPDGIYFLEPLYAILKSLLTLAMLIFSVAATSMAAYESGKKDDCRCLLRSKTVLLITM